MDGVEIAERLVDRGSDARERLQAVPAGVDAGQAAGHGDREAADEDGLRRAFLAHGRELLGFARRSVFSTATAEDVVQETFARAWRSRRRFDPSLGTLRTWLFAIERRVVIDVLTRQSRQRTEQLDDADAGTVDDRVEDALVGWQVATALERLDPPHRLVITELYFNGRTSKEVSALFGIPEGTVRSRAFYALRTMRGQLEELGWNA